MKLSCNIVRDLVGVVTDGAASNDTKLAVNAHLTNCPACARYYRDYARIAHTHRWNPRRRRADGAEEGYRALTERIRQRRREQTAFVGGTILFAVGVTVLVCESIRVRRGK